MEARVAYSDVTYLLSNSILLLHSEFIYPNASAVVCKEHPKHSRLNVDSPISSRMLEYGEEKTCFV